VSRASTPDGWKCLPSAPSPQVSCVVVRYAFILRLVTVSVNARLLIRPGACVVWQRTRRASSKKARRSRARRGNSHCRGSVSSWSDSASIFHPFVAAYPQRVVVCRFVGMPVKQRTNKGMPAMTYVSTCFRQPANQVLCDLFKTTMRLLTGDRRCCETWPASSNRARSPCTALRTSTLVNHRSCRYCDPLAACLWCCIVCRC
jgi:hypothetical protein